MNDRLAFLAQTIVKSKKVMDKVEKGDYSRGHVSAESVKLDVDPNALLETAPPGAVPPQPRIPQGIPQGIPQVQTMTPNINKNSRLPKGILESFAANPGMSPVMGQVGTPQALSNFQMTQLAEATKQVQNSGRPPVNPMQHLEQQAAANDALEKQRQMIEEMQGRAMEQQYNQMLQNMGGYSSPSAMLTGGYGQPQQPQYQQPQYQQPQYQQPAPQPAMDQNLIAYIIQETVKQTVQAVMEEINKPSSINENIQIKIGNKWFGGTIKTLKEQVNKPVKTVKG